MPGIVAMDHGGLEASVTEHGKNKINGVNGITSDASQPKEPALAPAASAKEAIHTAHTAAPSALYPSRMNDLPDEIVHITQGFIPLSALLTRLAQVTHNSLQETITELAKMPLPSGAANGLSSHSPTSDDVTSENLRKKERLLNFAQDHHAKWVKALVITEWSRKTDKVSKLIDLKFHVDQQRMLFDMAVDNMVNIKRDLTYARMPSPDLKTALQTLSTGSAPWMPDLQYIEPPQLTTDEQLKWINDLNTLLSLRLNLEEFHKIPTQFRDYEIGSGRVKFRVQGEFEVDLTIADEDFEKQFWFIDFRFDFKPTTSVLSETLRNYLEACVNDALAKDGLAGCYQFLHEYVLTCKINELRRQAIHMSKKAWTGTLKVEPLHRALAIQYWTSRTPPQGPKHWILIAVNSGRKGTDQAEVKQTSHLVAKWYRDNKEVENCDVTLGGKNLSVQDILQHVIGKHIEFLLRNIHAKLLDTSRFRNREAGMMLNISESDPTLSSLTTQIGYHSTTSLLIEPRTGNFVLKPHSRFTIQFEHQLNGSKDPIAEGATSLENVRCAVIEDEIHRSGSAAGWRACRPQLTTEEMKLITRKREWTKTIWLRQDGWGSEWFIAVFLAQDGDEWWLVETTRKPTAASPIFHARLPFNKGHPNLTEEFWFRLVLLSCGMIAQSVDLRELHQHQIKHLQNESKESATPCRVRVPTITFELATLFPGMVLPAIRQNNPKTGVTADEGFVTTMSLSPKQPWAKNLVAIDFQGVQVHLPSVAEIQENAEGSRSLVCVSYASISVQKPAKLKGLNGKIHRDVTYSSVTGKFRVRLRHAVGTPTLSTFSSRIMAIDRFVSFLEAMDEAKATMTSDAATLNQVSCFYHGPSLPTSQTEQLDEKSPSTVRWKMVMDLSGTNIRVKLERGNPHLRVMDLIDRLANMDGGIKILMVWLPSSLPALTALGEIENKWGDIVNRAEGDVEFSMRALDWMGVRYTLYGRDSSGQRTTRQLRLDCRLRLHGNEPWWHICRSESDGAEDEFTMVLQPIWDGKGEDWQGLATGAAGKFSGGVATMLHALDERLRAMVGDDDVVALDSSPVLQSASDLIKIG